MNTMQSGCELFGTRILEGATARHDTVCGLAGSSVLQPSRDYEVHESFGVSSIERVRGDPEDFGTRRTNGTRLKFRTGAFRGVCGWPSNN